ncbi:threonine-phosphate decarboxylase [Clostridium cavendishii DSM 21758]|uniref:Threonine-phosphate decarboxylase n=1 Tax=Clostridium cavendishii DSM 21758 TaxID=1121302 RepID=A0A1M6T8X5_9CLOT|nr:histidinol-phosphate transaminase [Clostridium cavendishii]SHK53502.1 threonine-phosphate decarboxylase [Clostridium cavendishii DSM 21758]
MKISKHGGDIYTEGLLKERALIDYSSNINPFGIPESFKNNINDILNLTVRYPDYKYRKLKQSIIDYHFKYEKVTLEEDELLLGNGASEVLEIFIRSINKLLIVVPSFIEYEELGHKWCQSVEYSFLNDNFEYGYDDILEKFKNCNGMILGNPNNPVGNRIDIDRFKEILDYAEANNKSVIVDEAFVEFMGENKSLTKLIKTYKSLFIVRAITKFFGMPGVRFGYGISSNKNMIKLMCESQNPWNVNTFGEHAAICSFNDEKYIAKTKKWINEELIFFKDKLSTLSFVEEVYETNCNFILVKLKGVTGTDLYEECLKQGYVIRKASNFRGLDDTYVRFAIKDRRNNELFLKAINNIKL